MKPENITKILESGQKISFFSLLTLMFWAHAIHIRKIIRKKGM